jgi:hypothetical protein
MKKWAEPIDIASVAVSAVVTLVLALAGGFRDGEFHALGMLFVMGVGAVVIASMFFIVRALRRRGSGDGRE